MRYKRKCYKTKLLHILQLNTRVLNAIYTVDLQLLHNYMPVTRHRHKLC